MSETQGLILSMFEKHPFAGRAGYTDPDGYYQFRRLYPFAHVSVSGYRTRRAELVTMGRLIPLPKPVASLETGRKMTVWSIPR